MGKKDKRGIIHNDYVRRKKKAEYHSKKKIQKKWKRQKTHVEAEQAGGVTLFNQIFSGQLDFATAEEEYERKLRGCKNTGEEPTKGGEDERIGTRTQSSREKKEKEEDKERGQKISKKKEKVKKKEKRTNNAAAAVTAKTVASSTEAQESIKKRKNKQGEGKDNIGEEVRNKGRKKTDKVEKGKKKRIKSDTAKKQEETAEDNEWVSSSWNEGDWGYNAPRSKSGHAFSKAQKEYEEKMKEKERAEQKWQEEQIQWAKKRRETKKQRHTHGRLLNQRTLKGQPNTQTMLEAWLQKKGLKV